MVVARKRRKQTNQRTLDLSGAEIVKPWEDGLAAGFVDMNQSPAAMLVGPLLEKGREAVGGQWDVFWMRIAVGGSGVSRSKGGSAE
jgi:hypothetical protein